MRAFFPARILIAVLLLAGACPAADETETDAVTAASYDATTGASQALEPVTVSGGFSVAFAVNDDGNLFIQARDLTDAYRRDELASDALFKDKLMVVRGTVEKTSKPDAAKPWVTLVGDDESGKKVRCSLKKGQLEGKSVQPGDSVQITGVCDGMKLSVSVTEGEISG